MRTLSRLLVLAGLASAVFSIAACNGERQAVPDPAIPPKPKVEQKT